MGELNVPLDRNADAGEPAWSIVSS
jgi:hypothetical protein